MAENSWIMPYLRAHHGMSLVELGRYHEAEPLLARAYRSLPPLPDDETANTVHYLIQLYDGWGKPERAAEWRAKLPTEHDPVASDAPAED